jgi:phage terminase large subunit-like protein
MTIAISIYIGWGIFYGGVILCPILIPGGLPESWLWRILILLGYILPPTLLSVSLISYERKERNCRKEHQDFWKFDKENPPRFDGFRMHDAGVIMADVTELSFSYFCPLCKTERITYKRIDPDVKEGC